MQFQSTHPIRGATLRDDVSGAAGSGYFNPRTPYGVRPPSRRSTTRSRSHFNPRTPYGVRLLGTDPDAEALEFQSTHPIRGATACAGRKYRRGGHFNPRTPYGVRPHTGTPCAVFRLISIHAPHTGCDAQGTGDGVVVTKFQSTHPIRGATANLTILTR